MPAPTRRRNSRKCSVPDCPKQSQTRRLCKAHGGGVHCRVPQCPKLAQSQGLCVAHGGGRRCQVTGCGKLAQYKRLCLAHGGGRRCSVADCLKHAQVRGCCKAHAKLLVAAKTSPKPLPSPAKSTQTVDMNDNPKADLVQFTPSSASKMAPKAPTTADTFYIPAHDPQAPFCPPLSFQGDTYPVLVKPGQPLRYARPASAIAPHYPPFELYRPACRQLYCQRRKGYRS
ncbi:hypothetical protein ON010_g6812 [Phytophthora cinnamomi]|nr:hypothetical protein ON010_g6812 [Phytophthora cinnamomi]